MMPRYHAERAGARDEDAREIWRAKSVRERASRHREQLRMRARVTLPPAYARSFAFPLRVTMKRSACMM